MAAENKTDPALVIKENSEAPEKQVQELMMERGQLAQERAALAKEREALAAEKQKLEGERKIATARNAERLRIYGDRFTRIAAVLQTAIASIFETGGANSETALLKASEAAEMLSEAEKVAKIPIL
jgi:hypothetical protein